MSEKWTEKPIGSFMKLLSGFPFPSNAFSKSEGFPLIRIRDIMDSSIETYFLGNFDSQFIVHNGDVLVGMDGDFNIRIWNNVDALLNQRILKVGILDVSELDLDFLFYWLQPYLQHINDITAATTVKHLSVRDLKFAKTKLPSVSVQRKIGSVLTTIDKAIGQTEALIEKYSLIKAGMMHDLFTRGLTPEGKLRPPRDQAPDLYKETPIGWIPKGWDNCTLGSACDWFSGGTPSKQNDAWWKGNVPWLSPKDMKVFEMSDTSEHVTQLAAISGSKIMPAKTVFIVIRGMILAHSFPVVLSSTDFCFNQDIKAVAGRGDLENRFLAFWFVSQKNLFLSKTTEATHGTKRFDMKDIYDLGIGIPKPVEQKQIVVRLDNVSDKLNVEAEMLAKLTLQKTGLMHDLLTGEVPVKVDEPQAAHV